MLVPGDVCEMSAEEQEDAVKVTAAEGEMGSVLGSLEHVTCRVFYIPGNVCKGRAPYSNTGACGLTPRRVPRNAHAPTHTPQTPA